jgi:2,4-dienoyl-CoA reductase-like NADH-dependent reductase (Old Yellow Enzyme family)
VSYPNLFTPVTIGPIELRNRVVSTSHQTGLVHDHLPTEDLVAYHEARACGGAGAIFIEATAIDQSGLLNSHTIGGFLPEIVPIYERLGEAVRAHGSRLFVQLAHGGREQQGGAPRAPAVGPSAIPSLRFKAEPRALTADEIAAVIDGYAVSARMAAQAGLDGIEVSIAHGYLLSQFINPVTNRRTDSYGGSQAARMRLAHEVLTAVREAAGPGPAVGVRLAADELATDGLDSAACAAIAAELQGTGLVDFISLALGHSAYPAASTWIAPPPPTPVNAIGGPAAAIRSAVPDAILIVATRVVELSAAEALVTDGTADAVGMTRALIADPELLKKAPGDRADELIECIGCNQSCIGHYHAGLPIGCAVNPRTGRERTLAPARRRSGRRVLVIGAGPAGVAAALEAASAGDTVTVLEREAELGGQLRLAGLAPAHAETWERYSRSTSARLRAAGVRIEFGVAAEPGLAAEFDLAVLATGARPYVPPLPSGPFAVLDAWEAIRDPERVSGPALVADWGGGWDGLDALERLIGAGVQATLACAAPHPGETVHQYQRNLYLARLDERSVGILHHTELATIDGELSLRHIFSGRTRALPAIATLVLSQGRVPDDALWPDLERHSHVVRAGDVLGPRTLEEAVLEGTLAVAVAG